MAIFSRASDSKKEVKRNDVCVWHRSRLFVLSTAPPSYSQALRGWLRGYSAAAKTQGPEFHPQYPYKSQHDAVHFVTPELERQRQMGHPALPTGAVPGSGLTWSQKSRKMASEEQSSKLTLANHTHAYTQYARTHAQMMHAHRYAHMCI